MHPETLIHNSKDEHQQDKDLDHMSNNADLDLDPYEPDPYYCTDNNWPPESYAVCRSKVADWLDRNTFIERTPSVKLGSSCQTPSSRRSVSITQKPKLSIIGFRKKPVRQMDGKTKTKHNDKMDNVRLFRNRSEPAGRDYCLLVTEPVSPRVSCAGRVGSVRVVRGPKGSVWRSFKAAFSNLIQSNRVG